jgi:hypothetical protein
MGLRPRLAVHGALLTVACLFGGLLVGVAVGFLVFELLPGGDDFAHPPPLNVTLAALPALAGFTVGSATWGVRMGRLAGGADRRRLAIAGALSFGPMTVALGIGLSALEPIAVAGFGGGLPVHRLFTVLFVPTAFLIAGVSAWAVGLGLRRPRLALALLWQVGLAAAAGFLVVNLALEAAGWVVGAPGAAERATMLTVMFAGNVGAALAGGASMGLALHRSSP